jgi:DNA repair photolyase
VYLNRFDPWKSPLCTCPPKYSLNPYTSCPHACRYCYITAYIPQPFRGRPKADLVRRLRKELRRADRSLPVNMATSTDPYPPMEARLHLTRGALAELIHHGFKVLLLTKSDMVLRDLDLLSRGRCVVQITITTMDSGIAKRLEPAAPSPGRRIEALRRLIQSGVPSAARVDPLIPGINDDAESLIRRLADIGVTHITSSVYKAKEDSLRRLIRAFPEAASTLEELYRHGERRGWTSYPPLKVREELLRAVREEALAHGMTFSTCRDGLEHLDYGGSCDGSHLLPGAQQYEPPQGMTT